jgi:diguanylate cyclase (GGDEF)-like protein
VDLQDVLDSIVAGAAELLGDEVVALRLMSEENPGHTELVSSVGLNDAVRHRIRMVPIDQGAVGRVVNEGRLVVMESYPTSPDALADLTADGLRSVMAVPIYQRGEIAGCLAVGSRDAEREYNESEREGLIAFAEHAGLALNDAQAVAETFHQAFHDSLTKLPNRALFLDRLEHAFARCARAGSGVAVLFADLDGFKTINDSLGHQAGDELLVMVAERLRSELRAEDTAARFGGDEFAILLEGAEDASVAQLVAERILRAFEHPFRLRGRDVYVTMSIGIAEGRAEADHLMRNADLAMYQAKNSGKGHFEVFEPGMHATAVRRLELEAALRHAADRGELVLDYQPICRLRSGEMTGVEALLRWHHPEKGLIPPNDFIPIAEEGGQILGLGRWVLNEACRQAAEWKRLHPTANQFDLSVNVSGVQLAQVDLVEQVRATIGRHNVDPGRLVLEITETALMTDTDTNVMKLRALKELGVQLAVDDFGTGYSSLEYLRRFPIDILKVAKSFVDGLTDPATGPGLVRAIVDLADSFGLNVIAEGIEHREQRDALIELGCELGQGFHFARPVEPLAIGARLESGAVAAT